MGRYSSLTDEELQEKITLFSTAIETIALGGEVAVIVTDGRRMELVASNVGMAENILRLLEDEQEKRANGGVLPGRALSMRFLRP